MDQNNVEPSTRNRISHVMAPLLRESLQKGELPYHHYVHPQKKLNQSLPFWRRIHQNYLGIHHHKPPKSKKKKTVSSTSKWRKQHIQPSHHLKNPSQQPASKAIFRCNWEPGCRAGCWGPPVWRKNQVGSQEMNPWGYPNTTPNTGHHQDCHSVSFRYLFSKKTWHMMTWCTNYIKLCIFQWKLEPVTNLTYLFCLPVSCIMTILGGSVKPPLKIGLLSKTLQEFSPGKWKLAQKGDESLTSIIFRSLLSSGSYNWKINTDDMWSQCDGIHYVPLPEKIS